MAEQLDPNEIVTLEELAISNMWETAALVEAHRCMEDNAAGGKIVVLVDSS